jgi:hypothetical protein
MANVSKLIFGAAIVAASPALAQYAPQSDPSISVHPFSHSATSPVARNSRFSASRLTGLLSQKMRLSRGARKLLGIERQIALLCWLVRNAKNGRHCVTFVICDGLAE